MRKRRHNYHGNPNNGRRPRKPAMSELEQFIPEILHKAWCGTEAEERALSFGHKPADFFLDEDGVATMGYICEDDNCGAMVWLRPGNRPPFPAPDNDEWASVPARSLPGSTWEGTLIANPCGWPPADDEPGGDS